MVDPGTKSYQTRARGLIWVRLGVLDVKKFGNHWVLKDVYMLVFVEGSHSRAGIIFHLNTSLLAATWGASHSSHFTLDNSFQEMKRGTVCYLPDEIKRSQFSSRVRLMNGNRRLHKRAKSNKSKQAFKTLNHQIIRLPSHHLWNPAVNYFKESRQTWWAAAWIKNLREILASTKLEQQLFIPPAREQENSCGDKILLFSVLCALSLEIKFPQINCRMNEWMTGDNPSV